MRRRHTTTPLMTAALVAVTAIAAALPGSAGATRPGSAKATVLELPAPTGRQAIGTTTLHLVDRSRRDPFTGGRRELMVQLWYPAAKPRTAPARYVGPGTAAALETALGLPKDTFGSLRTHAARGAAVAPGRHPLLLFSHGLLTLRGIHTSLLEELASRGYVVAAIDHTHDAVLVELPSGRMVEGAVPPQPAPDENRLLLATRVADVRFVLDRLSRSASARTGFLARRLDLTRVGALGHSFGGATVAAAMDVDPRLRAGVNLDGKVWGPVVSRGLERPFLLAVGDSFGGRLTSDQARFVSRLRGPHWTLRLVGAGHFSFTDLARFAVARPPLGRAFDIGTVDAARADDTVRAYVVAFFDRALLGKRGRLLDGPSAAYPDVRFVIVPQSKPPGSLTCLPCRGRTSLGGTVG